MYEFSYDYSQPKYQDKAHLCYLDADSLKMFIKALSMMLTYQNYIVEMLLPIGTNQKNNWINEGSIRPKDYDRSCRT